MIYLIALLLAFIVALLLLQALIHLLRRFHITEQPRADRWHRSPTPKFGGIGIFVATFIAFLGAYFLIRSSAHEFPMTLLLVMILIFVFGFVDDLKPLTPIGKLITQIIVASAAVYFGYTTNFFSPRLGDTFLARFMNSAVSLFWLV
ncbi:MAG: hypothetical protein D6735_07860, partial [Acidobacteria bacterium]